MWGSKSWAQRGSHFGRAGGARAGWGGRGAAQDGCSILFARLSSPLSAQNTEGPPRGLGGVHLETLALGSLSHILPTRRARQQPLHPPQRWVGTPVPGSGGPWKPWSRITALSPGITGAQSEASPPGPACRPALEPSQPPFLAQPRRRGRQAAPRSYGRRTGVKSASTFPSGRHKGQGPSGTGGGLSRREGGSAWPESLGWAPRPSLQGVLACSADNIPPGACLE